MRSDCWFPSVLGPNGPSAEEGGDDFLFTSPGWERVVNPMEKDLLAESNCLVTACLKHACRYQLRIFRVRRVCEILAGSLILLVSKRWQWGLSANTD